MSAEASTTRRRPHYANVASTLALVVALGGTGYAASQVPAHSVGTKQLKTGAVTAPKLAQHAVTRAKLVLHSVGHGQLSDNSVTGRDVVRNSVSLADIVGVDVVGSLSVSSLAAHSCVTLSVNVAGAKPGQVVLLTFRGNVAVAPGLLFEPLKVTSTGIVTLRVCNPSNAASPSMSSAGVRVVTFG